MKPILGHEIGQVLCDALGLPKNTFAFTLRCKAMEVVKVECEYFPEDAEALGTALMQYELLPRRGAWSQPVSRHPAEVIGFDAWMTQRTDLAHADFMKRTSRLLWCDWRAAATAADIAGIYGISTGEATP